MAAPQAGHPAAQPMRAPLLAPMAPPLNVRCWVLDIPEQPPARERRNYDRDSCCLIISLPVASRRRGSLNQLAQDYFDH